jgi:uncharacterized cupin superfamily protein
VLALPEINRTRYPGELAKPVAGRFVRRLTSSLGLTHLGLNLVRLVPGAWSSQRHWHENEDEFLHVFKKALEAFNQGIAIIDRRAEQ